MSREKWEYNLNLKAAEWVEVRGREEILATLDEHGRLDNMPFMPEMLSFCGKRFQVAARAHKTCDPAHNPWSIRRVTNAVHLQNARCNGEGHGGCQAGCLIFWKEAWLKRLPKDFIPQQELQAHPRVFSGNEDFCTVENILASSRKPDQVGEAVYSCQATELREYTSAMSPWNPKQYIQDLTSGNLSTGLADKTWKGRLIEKVLGVISLLRALTISIFTGRLGWTFYPSLRSTLDKTPDGKLDLKPGEIVEVRSIEEIMATVNKQNRNRGLLFDGEMSIYCGGIYRVLRCVSQIVNENTGKMMHFKNPCIVLEGVICKSYYHRLCPRAIYPYWRENWLKRVSSFPPSPSEQERSCEAVNCEQV